METWAGPLCPLLSMLIDRHRNAPLEQKGRGIHGLVELLLGGRVSTCCLLYSVGKWRRSFSPKRFFLYSIAMLAFVLHNDSLSGFPLFMCVFHQRIFRGAWVRRREPILP